MRFDEAWQRALLEHPVPRDWLQADRAKLGDSEGAVAFAHRVFAQGYDRTLGRGHIQALVA
jgi:hypothetical protein